MKIKHRDYENAIICLQQRFPEIYKKWQEESAGKPEKEVMTMALNLWLEATDPQ
jgi:hypothetical protein